MGILATIRSRFLRFKAGPAYCDEIDQLVRERPTGSPWLDSALALAARNIRIRSHEPLENAKIADFKASFLRTLRRDREFLDRHGSEEDRRAYFAVAPEPTVTFEQFDAAIATMKAIADICRAAGERQAAA